MTRQFKRFKNVRGALAGIFGALALMSLMAPVASAQEAVCQAHEVLARTLDGRFAETPIGIGLERSGKLFEIFAAADGKTWTMVVTDAQGQSCVVAIGESWLEPVPVIHSPSA